ncbi:MAG: hypothetical protein IMY73_02680 [Bacteroidetes bacterium]|nr:hypothetical protein [Bacteroidota bacterium]
MKKIILILSVIFCCSTVFAQSKEKNKTIKYKEDKNILFPALEVRLQFYSQDIYDSDITKMFFLTCIGANKYYNIQSDYSISAECTYRIFRYLEVGGQLGYSRVYLSDDYNDSGYVKKRGHSFYIMPKVRCTWYEYSFVRLYSSVSLGVSYINGPIYDAINKNSRIVSLLDFSPLGIALGGKSWFGFYEFFNQGDLGQSSFGVGYRFPVK